MSERTPAIICDLDGTLGLLNGRSPYNATHSDRDLLNLPVALIVQAMTETYELEIVLITGREERDREPTERWLAEHKIPYAHLYMRPTNDSRQDAIVKREIYERHIKPRYDVLFVLDDRNQVVEMWRGLGLTCLQVAEGNF